MAFDDRVLVIAEAGVNHNGDLALAKELVAAASEADADIVKFQTFKAKDLVTKNAEKATYQKENCGANETQFEMLKKLELNEEMHFEIIECCNKHNIQFLSTAFDLTSLKFLTNEINLDLLKLPSGEITNGPFIHEHAKTGTKIILSTGMANLGEIEAALAVIAHGYIRAEEKVTSLDQCYNALATAEGYRTLKDKVTLLHCTSSYPAPIESVNLRAIDTLNKAFGLDVGYSDHTEGIIASIAAVARNCSVIEKHFTLDKNLPGPDHKASLDPKELGEMISGIRAVSRMMGNGVKLANEIELSTKIVARKSVVAKKAISAGDKFSADNLTIKRPGTGASPMKWWKLLNSSATRNYDKDDAID